MCEGGERGVARVGRHCTGLVRRDGGRGLAAGGHGGATSVEPGAGDGGDGGVDSELVLGGTGSGEGRHYYGGNLGQQTRTSIVIFALGGNSVGTKAIPHIRKI